MGPRNQPLRAPTASPATEQQPWPIPDRRPIPSTTNLNARDGNVEQSLGHMGMLRADAIMWAAEGERGEASVFHDRISEVCGALAPASAGNSRRGTR